MKFVDFRSGFENALEEASHYNALMNKKSKTELDNFIEQYTYMFEELKQIGIEAKRIYEKELAKEKETLGDEYKEITLFDDIKCIVNKDIAEELILKMDSLLTLGSLLGYNIRKFKSSKNIIVFNLVKNASGSSGNFYGEFILSKGVTLVDFKSSYYEEDKNAGGYEQIYLYSESRGNIIKKLETLIEMME